MIPTGLGVQNPILSHETNPARQQKQAEELNLQRMQILEIYVEKYVRLRLIRNRAYRSENKNVMDIFEERINKMGDNSEKIIQNMHQRERKREKI